MVSKLLSQSRDRFYLKLAFDMRILSKCLRATYGAVLVSADHRICSTGVNGKPRGSINDHECYRLGLENNASKPNCCIHAEANCIMQSHVTDRPGSTLYVSGVPCTDCALMIMQSGISTLVIGLEVGDDGQLVSPHLGDSDLDFFKKYGVPIEIRTYHVSHLSLSFQTKLVSRTFIGTPVDGQRYSICERCKIPYEVAGMIKIDDDSWLCQECGQTLLVEQRNAIRGMENE